jgi:protoheme IX farnesyltransferase
LSPAEVFAFGVLCGLAGTLYLLLLLPSPCAAGVAGFTFLAYVCVYTPMKRLTSLNTLVGAIPGAMPPIIGWCAVRGEVTAEALTLFVILFLWQVPHFLAIAWMYRDEYAQAGLVMLPVIDPQGTSTARQMILYSLALVATSLAPVFLGSAGLLYLVGAVLLGSHFTLSAVRFQTRRSHSQAKQVLRASLVYLPGLLVALIVDRSVIILW